MPRVRWGVSASKIDEFDRESQYEPYRGPIPPNGVYRWRVKVLKFAAGTREKFPQLRIGLEMVPRSKEERKYKGFFVMTFRSVADHTVFAYAPFLDAIGVSSDDFTDRCISDEEGNIKKIGRWRNDNKQLIDGELVDSVDPKGTSRKDVKWMGAPEDESDEFDDGEEAEEEYDAEEEEFEEEENEPKPRQRKPAARTRQPVERRRNPRGRRPARDEEDPF